MIFQIYAQKKLPKTLILLAHKPIFWLILNGFLIKAAAFIYLHMREIKVRLIPLILCDPDKKYTEGFEEN